MSGAQVEMNFNLFLGDLKHLLLQTCYQNTRQNDGGELWQDYFGFTTSYCKVTTLKLNRGQNIELTVIE